MHTLTLTLPTGLVETIVNIVDFVLFIMTCMIKGAIALWVVCFSLWIVGLLITGAYMTIKSMLTTNK